MHGLKVHNINGDVLIDSDIFSYQFTSKATYSHTFVTPDLINHSNTNIASSQEQGRIFVYHFASNGPKPPLVFIKPIDISNNAPFASVIFMSHVRDWTDSTNGFPVIDSSTWEIWVLQTDKDILTYPQLYCFSTMDQATVHPRIVLALYAANGSTSLNVEPLEMFIPAGTQLVYDHGVGFNPSIFTFNTDANIGDETVYGELTGNPVGYMSEMITSNFERYGLVTWNENGARTFDSRMKPLRIIGGGDATHTVLPHSGAVGSGGNVYLDANNWNTFDTGVTGLSDDLMYACPSIAMACQEYSREQSTEECDGVDAYGLCIGKKTVWARGDLWWSFYRGGFRLTSANAFDAGWTIYASGHVWDEQSDSSWAGLLIVAGLVLTGGLAGAVAGFVIGEMIADTDAISGGYRPYQNDSRNSDQVQGFIITRPSYYD